MKQILFLLTLLVGLVSQSQTNETSNEVGTVEVVRFRLKPEVDQEIGKEKLIQLNQCVMQFDGFIERKLTVNEAGEWLDIVYWTSKAAALKAAELVAQDPKALESFAVIDESSIVISHFDLVENYLK